MLTHNGGRPPTQSLVDEKERTRSSWKWEWEARPDFFCIKIRYGPSTLSNCDYGSEIANNWVLLSFYTTIHIKGNSRLLSQLLSANGPHCHFFPNSTRILMKSLFYPDTVKPSYPCSIILKLKYKRKYDVYSFTWHTSITLPPRSVANLFGAYGSHLALSAKKEANLTHFYLGLKITNNAQESIDSDVPRISKMVSTSQIMGVIFVD